MAFLAMNGGVHFASWLPLAILLSNKAVNKELLFRSFNLPALFSIYSLIIALASAGLANTSDEGKALHLEGLGLHH